MDLCTIFNSHLQRNNLISAMKYGDEIQSMARIGVFVLLIGKLEDKLKTLVYTYAKQEYIKKITGKPLGTVLEEVKNILNEIINSSQNISNDYRIRRFFLPDNINTFITQCNQVKKLRDDLIHNIVSPYKSNVKTIDELLSKVYFFIALTDTKQRKIEKASAYLLNPKKNEVKMDEFEQENINIIFPGGKIREDLTISDLIDVVHFYYKGIKDFLKNQETK